MFEVPENTSGLWTRIYDYKFKWWMWEFIKSIINSSYDMDTEMLRRLQSKKSKTEAILEQKLLPSANDSHFLPEPKKQLPAANDDTFNQLKDGTNG